MLTVDRMSTLCRCAGGLMLLGLLLASCVYVMGESNLEDEERLKLFAKAFRDGYIVVSQPGPGQSLRVSAPKKYSELPSADQESFGKERWEKMGKQVYRFAAAVNQGVGDPFEYAEGEGGRTYIVGVKESALKYQNPFEQKHDQARPVAIDSSEAVAERRRGWRIVGRDLTLFLRPGAPAVQVEPGTQYAVLVGGEFTLSANSNPKALLRVHGEGNAPVLRVEALGTGGGAAAVTECRHGSYFIWDGRPYAVFRSDLVAQDARDNTVGTLVFTKMVNGRPVRMHVLGRAAANLIGSKVGGISGSIEGALLQDRARRLVLTLDPELQAEAYYVLRAAVDRLPKIPPTNITRERYAAMTILDAETGQVLANAGLPGYDPAWEGSRLILLSNTGRITYNAANFAHMPGSAVKVLTSAMGYLLSGKGSAEMLPASINRLAVQQSFQNAFGAPLPTEDFYVDDSNAQYVHSTPKGEDDFKLKWRPKGLRPDFVSALKAGFQVAEVNTDPLGAAASRRYREDLIQDDKLADSYFDKEARFDFFPEGSRLPLADAADLETFLMMSQGGSETKFTTLRLAAILGTVSSGKVMHPYIVESVFDEGVKGPRNRVSRAPAAYTEFRAALENLEGANVGNVSLMSRVVREYLGKVCSPGRTDGKHTGFYINKRGDPVYMTQDDPTTPEDEHEARQNDFGKTGTADHGKEDQNYDDSIFVYQHGRYIVAIWLERADGGGVSHPAHAALNEMVSFIDRLEPQRQ